MDAAHPSLSNPPPPAKRQRKNAHPRRLPLEASRSMERIAGESVEASKLCKNAACRASMGPEEPFCRRCSCCSCHKFDENKDPSLWLVCGSEAPSEGDSCGASYHLECVLKQEKGGVARTELGEGLDGSFYCVHCGKVNDLLGCLRKQLSTARKARRVDTLCYRLSLSRRILNGNPRVKNLHGVVDSAARKLEAEVGTLDGLPAKMGRGIVNRLSSGAEVQSLCAAAIATVDSMLSSSLGPPSISVDFEDVSPTSLTVVVGLREEAPQLPATGYSLWCRKVEAAKYPVEPVAMLAEPERRFSVSGLEPSTGYVFKVVGLASSGEFGKRELWFTTPGSRKDAAIEVEGDSSKKKSQSPSEDCGESFNTLPESSSGSLQKKKPEIPDLEEEASVHGSDGAAAEQEIPGSTVHGGSHWDSSNSTELDLNQALEPPRSEEESNEPPPPEGQAAPPPYGCSEAIILPFTPSKLETTVKTGGGGEGAWFAEQGKEPCPGSSSKKKKKRAAPPPREGGALAADYEYCTSFRVKFLTWFSLRASPQERRVVSVFVDAMADDPPSLAGQLVDTFSEGIRRKPPPPLPTGFCTKLWH
ncbi:unnamed protein product [Spirodela intermedia]|uniref:Fibronectin type-III domain-containing protein n=1 Tax=Spirodela intermedia TaxID=51605 RepID=A0A7I8IYV2_SPIIN|nr:unnamed protein product [Spirodela intermedia]CAA6662313.1 unnamed protein product [Spirodela intermedia]